jgi:hypothetical protein
MNKRFLAAFGLVAALSLQTCLALAATAADKSALTTTVPTTSQENTQSENQGQIYGVQLMTPQERTEFRARMSAAKTSEEREQIRKENHQAMQERAESHGLTLPDQPSAGTRGMGQGGGMMNQDGSMMNQGGSMGHGGGMGSGFQRSQ